MAEERKESIVLDFSVDLEDSVSSIEKLTKANKELREERKKLNLDTNEGKKRVGEINAQLDKNTSKITANTSAIEKQRANIGNYKSALDGVHPALGKVGQGLEAGTSGLKAMTMQALRFIATPIGAVIAALVAVFALLKSALSQNDALMDKFENITNAVGVVLEIVVARIGKLGEALIALASGNFEEAINLTSEAFSGLADEIQSAVIQQQLFLDASRQLEDSQRSLRIEVAKQQTVITGLIKESKNRNLSLDEQSAKLVQASKLEADLQRTREDIAFRDLVITSRRLRADKEFQQQANETFDQYINRLLESTKLAPDELDKIADKVVALEEARNSGLVLQQKIENDLTAIQLKRVEAIKKQTEALSEQAAQDAANKRLANKTDVKLDAPSTDPFLETIKNNAEIQTDFDIRLKKDQLERDKEFEAERIRLKNQSAEKQIETEKRIQEQTLQAAADVTGGIAGLLNQQGEAYKLAASAQVIISTYASAQKAYEAAFLPIPTVASPALGVAFAAAAVLKGIANLAAINGVEFFEGGWTGPGGKYDPKGIVHANEVVWNQEDVRLSGGPMAANAMRPTARLRPYFDGGLVSNSIAQPINQQMDISNAIKNMGPFVVSAKEITKVQNRVKVKEKISKR